MLNKLSAFLKRYDMVAPGDTLICAVSGGADSVALLFGMYLLKDRLGITLEAAHFNHHLRGEESDRDETFVKAFCHRYDIPLHLGGGQVVPGEKGLEAAAREARYAFLRSLPGKIATAHTADDNAETVLLHLIRGTGLRGLGGIHPVSGGLIRPMLTVTRREVEEFLTEWCLPHVEDSSNESDAYLRNRVRHQILPLLAAENPRIGENLSAMALRLRQDEEFLARQSAFETLPGVSTLRRLHPAQRSRIIETFLRQNGCLEPEQSHIAQVETLIFSERPSARTGVPGGITVSRQYDRLTVLPRREPLEEVPLPSEGTLFWGPWQIAVMPGRGEGIVLRPEGTVFLGPRRQGDAIRLPGGSKSLKKLFIDRKIPAADRGQIPVLRDSQGILAVYGLGMNLDRAAGQGPEVTITIQPRET